MFSSFRPLRAALAAISVASAFLLAGCAAEKPDPAVVGGQVLAMGKAGNWAAAMPLAKRLALAYPEAPGAHYLLGKTYLHSASPHLVQAEGEFRTALAMLQRGGTLVVPWADAEAEEPLELVVRRDLALVSFRWIREAMRMNFPAAAIRERLIEAKSQVDAALKLSPGDGFLTEMRTTIDEYLAGPFKDIPPPEPPAVTPAA